jgi:hypothetical protein
MFSRVIFLELSNTIMISILLFSQVNLMHGGIRRIKLLSIRILYLEIIIVAKRNTQFTPKK